MLQHLARNAFSLLAILLIASASAGPGQHSKSTSNKPSTRNSERHLTKQLLKLVHKLYQNQTLLERRFHAQKHELASKSGKNGDFFN